MLVNGSLVVGAGAIQHAVRAAPGDSAARYGWTPIRVGIAADGEHGFTVGYTTLRDGNGAERPGKYVAYWRRTTAGWQVSACKRSQRPAGPVSLAPMPALLPAPAATSQVAAATLPASPGESLHAAEVAFSDRAQVVGLGEAFREFGSPDALHTGGPADTLFLVGADAIGRSIGASMSSPDAPILTWAPDIVRVAGSGDLGVSLGYITVRPRGVAASYAPRRVAYMTVWRRDGPMSPWRYVAE